MLVEGYLTQRTRPKGQREVGLLCLDFEKYRMWLWQWWHASDVVANVVV